jgi:hypothetical protein
MACGVGPSVNSKKILVLILSSFYRISNDKNITLKFNISCTLGLRITK